MIFFKVGVGVRLLPGVGSKVLTGVLEAVAKVPLPSRNDGDTMDSPTASFSPARFKSSSKVSRARSKPRDFARVRCNSCMAIVVQVRRDKAVQHLLLT